MNFSQKRKKILILSGVALLLIATSLVYQKFNYLWKETNFHNIAHNIDKISILFTNYPEAYPSPDWNPESGEKVKDYFFVLEKESQEMLEILSIIAKYSYELHADSVATKNRSYGYNGTDEEKYLLSLITYDSIFGIPTKKVDLVMNDLGQMNVNKRTYNMNSESALEMMEELMMYLKTHPNFSSIDIY